jgi:hypothetical protein
MQTATVSRYTISFGLSLAICSVINALVVVAKEKSPAVMAGMQKMTGHHWITHSVIILILFVVFGLVLARLGGAQGMKVGASRLIGTILGGVLTASVIIIGFYLIGD